jgi:sporulation protein YqfC
MHVITNKSIIRKHKKNHFEIKKNFKGDSFRINKFTLKKKDELINSLVSKLGISEDIVTGAEIISMVGRRNLVIENYIKIIEYENDKIVVRTKRNYIYILGDNLRMEYLLDNEIRISGLIISITLK